MCYCQNIYIMVVEMAQRLRANSALNFGSQHPYPTAQTHLQLQRQGIRHTFLPSKDMRTPENTSPKDTRTHTRVLKENKPFKKTYKSIKKHAKLGVVGHVSHTFFWELEAGELKIQIQPG